MAAAVKPPVFNPWGPDMRVFNSDTGAPPTVAGDGVFEVGDLIVNSVPTAGGTWAWVCVTRGAGGTAVFKTIAIGA